MGKMMEHDDKPDKGGNRGSNFGMGKETHSRGDLSEGDVKRGYKSHGAAPMKGDDEK